ncbi:MAG: tetratricopeptide repeat protein [Ardenticatenaceae bacterium]|nr:tetratricopeptide repeat protein [Ardenticatenaceae bacterium]
MVLANLARQTPGAVLAAFTGGDAAIDPLAPRTGDPRGRPLWQDKTKSILRCVEYSHSNLSPEAQALLGCLAPFTGVINANWLPQYTAQLKEQAALANLPFARWNEVLQEAMNWGLLTPHEIGGGYLRLQPILPYFLRQRLRIHHFPSEKDSSVTNALISQFREAVDTAFYAYYDGVGSYLGKLIQSIKPQECRLGQILIGQEYENLMRALKLTLTYKASFGNIYNSLASYLRTKNAFSEEQAICEMILAQKSKYPKKAIKGEMGSNFIMAYANLGALKLSLNLYKEAEQIFQKTLKLIQQVEESPEIRRKMWEATTYYQLGRVAQEQRQWETAERHYQQALSLFAKFNDRRQATAQHQLGRVAEEQQQLTIARSRYQQALQLFIKFNDLHNSAKTYQHLGFLAMIDHDFKNAKTCFEQELRIYIAYNDGRNQGIAYHNLGLMTVAQQQWMVAIDHYQQALQIFIEFKDRYSQAKTYHQLGMVSQEQQQWETAERYYQQALQIYIEVKDRYNQAHTYLQLGIVAGKQKNWPEAFKYLFQDLVFNLNLNDEHETGITTHSLTRVLHANQALARVWKEAQADSTFDKSAVLRQLAAILGITPAEAATLLAEQET